MPLDFYDQQADDDTADAAAGPRPYISIYFECCNIYTRVYRRPEDRQYVGRCPRCLAQVTLRVGPDGTSDRIFRAS